MSSQWQKDLQDHIYPTYEREYQPVAVFPSEKEEYTLSLKKSIGQVLPDLENDFKAYDMEVLVKDRNKITVTGYPPDNDFDQRDVLKIVQGRDSGAAMNSWRTLLME